MRLQAVPGCSTPTVRGSVKIEAMAPTRITRDSGVSAPTQARLTCPHENRAGQDPAHRQHSRDGGEFLSHQAPARLLRPTLPRQSRIKRKSRERRPLLVALLFSLLIHALLLSLRFGGDEFGLPGLAFPWRDRRIEVPDLRVVLVPVRVAPAEPAVMSAADTSQSVSVDRPRAGTPVLALRVVAAPDRQETAATTAGASNPPMQAEATRGELAPGASIEAPVPARGPDRLLPVQVPAPAAIDVEPSDGLRSVVRAERSAPVSVTSAAPSASRADSVDWASPDRGYAAQEGQREDVGRHEAARLEAAKLEREENARQAAAELETQRQEAAQQAARLEGARLEARQENARQAAVQLETQRQQAVRQEAARVEATRLEAERQENARQAAVQREAQRQDASRQEAARLEAARLEAERQEKARQAAAQLEAQRQDATREEGARLEAARAEAERQETALQAAVQLEAQRQHAVRQEAARVEAARLEAERRENARQAAAEMEAQRQEAARQQAARLEAARLEAERQEEARHAAAQLEAQGQDAARQEGARLEAARVEAERQEMARQAAIQLEAQRQHAVRQQAARVEAARLEAERRENARQAAARLEPERQVAARQQATQVQPPVEPEAAQLATSPQAVPREVEQDQAARREAALRAIGRQLDEEAARRQAASTTAPLPSTLPYSLSTARRVRLWGRTDPNVELVQYAEAWARKIQFNTVVETIRDLVRRPHTPSMVTVAVRSDGSVESVTFVVSSGVAEIDEAIRRIVESQRPYPAFPRALAREFDVIEIRRTWYFDSGVRLQ